MNFRLLPVKRLIFILLWLPLYCAGQIYTEETLIARLKNGTSIPEEVLSKRSAVLYSHAFTTKEITVIHENLIRSGIDAIAYFKTDGVLAGGDIASAYTAYFVRREVSNLVILQKQSSGYTIYITSFNGKDDFVNPDQVAWSAQSASLSEMFNTVYRTALGSNKKKNLLINDIAETDLPVRVINGIRSETFAYDLKVDNLAVPVFNDAALDKEMEEIFKNYPFRYQMTSHTATEKELRSKGFLYILCFVYTRGSVAKELLGYPAGKPENVLASVSYQGGQAQVKSIPAETPVFKFYVRHIDSGNIFLGTKWDAETSWQQALQNFIKGFRAEMKID